MLVKARMQCGSLWKDVCILNYSQRGLGLTCDTAPPRGAYLEIRRGPFVIVARVAWSRGHRFGARTQDPVAHVAIVGKVVPSSRQEDGASPVERRQAVRVPSPVFSDKSRQRGRAFEFVGTVIAIVATAGLVADVAYAQLSAPLDRVRSALSGQ